MSRPRRARRAQPLRARALYTLSLVREFRATLLATVALVALGAALFAATPQEALHGRKPDLLMSAFASWTALFGQVVFNPPATWYLQALHGVYPLLGFLVLGEGIVRFALLMTSRRRGEREWTKVMASTYRDHVVVCGLGHLGLRVLEALRARQEEVVAIERERQGRFVPAALATGTPILFADMRDDAVLKEAGVAHAKAIVVATNDDMANLEVALDARRMNPGIRVLARFFDQQIASKIQRVFGVDEAFSDAALAAPLIADRAVAERAPAKAPAPP